MMKRIFFEFLHNPFKVLLVLLISKIALGISAFLQVAAHLPENPTDADNLNQFQFLLGFLLTLAQMLLGIFNVVLQILLIVSVVIFIYKLFRKSK